MAELQVTQSHNVFHLYASRLARLMLLKRKCGSKSSVLDNEIELVRQARAELQDYVLSNVTESERETLRECLPLWVKKTALEKIETYDEDESITRSVSMDVQLINLSDLIPTLN